MIFLLLFLFRLLWCELVPFGVLDRTLRLKNTQKIPNLLMIIDTNIEQHYQKAWKSCLTQIASSTSESEFSRWFAPLEPLGFDGTVLRLKVPTQSHLQHIEQNYIPLLRPIIRNLFGIKARIQYAVPQPSASQVPSRDSKPAYVNRGYKDNAAANETASSSIKNPFVVDGVTKVNFDSQLKAELSFANHVEGECNRLARTAGIAISQNPGTTSFNPLFIYGNSGLGKTHIAQAIGLATKELHPQARVLYVSTNHFQSQFQTAAWKGELSNFINFYQTIDVLIIDDIQELAGKPGTQNIFFNIFNHLRLLGKQLILTSDRPPVELTDIEERLITRFKWGLSAPLTLPDHQTKLRILENKSRMMGVELDDTVKGFLAENIKANVRELEGALTSLEAHSRLLGKKITMDLTREIMGDIVRFSSREVTVSSIIELVCEHTGVELKDMVSSSRLRPVAQARQVAMYLARQYTKEPLATIGAAFGKNHATVMHACKTVVNLADTDKTIWQTVEKLKSQLM